MKTMKRAAALAVALILCLSVSVGVWADKIDLSKNAITVKNVKAGATYHLYKMLDLESYNTESGAYAYKVNSAWSNFFTGSGAGAAYVEIDSQGYVTWKNDKKDVEPMEAFGKAADKYASDNSLQPLKTATVAGFEKAVIFGALEPGYYLITSTVGTKVSVETTPDNTAVVVNDKNEEPTIEKQVKEDSTDLWGEENTAQIGDTVEFKTTIHAKPGAQGYILHDQMTEGLTLNQDSIAVKVVDTALTKGTDYTVAFNTDDSCDFEIAFTQTYLDTITANTDVLVTYTAILNDKAVISTDANINKTKLNYGEEHELETAWDETKTYTFKFDVVKTDANKKLLTGAEFELYDAETGGTKIALVKEEEGVYRVATTVEKNAEGFTSAVIEVGKATVKGMDADTTYWLEEIKAPAGYNKLSGRVEVKIENSNLTTTMTGDTWAESNGGVQITNQSGTELPSTGGVGTTIFYAAGGILAVLAVVLLVTRKRMGAEN